jgi:hypothetical protein
MNKLKEDLIRQARDTYKDILPCTPKSDLADCFTTEEDRVLFWFNTRDKTTHMIAAKM